MGEVQTDQEILELAIAREQQAHDLYILLAEQLDNMEVSAVFEDLGREELEHRAKLEFEYIKTGRVLPDIQPTKLSVEAVFGDSGEQIDYGDILRFAIDKEEVSFRLYVTLIAQVQDHASKETLLALAEEEVKHKLRFETEYENLLEQG